MKTHFILLVIASILTQTYQLQTTIRERLNSIETKFDAEFEKVFNKLKEFDKKNDVISNQLAQIKENFNELKSTSSEDLSSLRHQVNELNTKEKIVHEKVKELNTKIQEISVSSENNLNNLTAKINSDLLVNEENINKKFELVSNSLNVSLTQLHKSVQKDLSVLRNDLNEDQQKQNNEINGLNAEFSELNKTFHKKLLINEAHLNNMAAKISAADLLAESIKTVETQLNTKIKNLSSENESNLSNLLIQLNEKIDEVNKTLLSDALPKTDDQNQDLRNLSKHLFGALSEMEKSFELKLNSQAEMKFSFNRSLINLDQNFIELKNEFVREKLRQDNDTSAKIDKNLNDLRSEFHEEIRKIFNKTSIHESRLNEHKEIASDCMENLKRMNDKIIENLNSIDFLNTSLISFKEQLKIDLKSQNDLVVELNENLTTFKDELSELEKNLKMLVKEHTRESSNKLNEIFDNNFNKTIAVELLKKQKIEIEADFNKKLQSVQFSVNNMKKSLNELDKLKQKQLSDIAIVNKSLIEINQKSHQHQKEMNRLVIKAEIRETFQNLSASNLNYIKNLAKRISDDLHAQQKNFEVKFDRNACKLEGYVKRTLNETIKNYYDAFNYVLGPIRKEFFDDQQKQDREIDFKIETRLLSFRHEFDEIISQKLNETRVQDLSKSLYKTPTKLRLTLKTNRRSVSCILLLENGDLASSGEGNSIKIWNTTDGSLKKSIYGHKASVRALATLRNGNLASGSVDRTIKIWSKDGGELVVTLTEHRDTVIALAVFHNRNFASGSWDRKIKIWMENGTLIKTLHEHSEAICSLLVLPNDDLVSGSADNSIKIWSSGGDLKRTILGHASWVWALAYLKNGELVSGSRDRTIKIWSADGQIRNTFAVHNASVHHLVVLPNGNLASAFGDGVIKIFNDSGVVMSTLTNANVRVDSLVVLPNGDLASSCSDGTVKIWTS